MQHDCTYAALAAVAKQEVSEPWKSPPNCEVCPLLNPSWVDEMDVDTVRESVRRPVINHWNIENTRFAQQVANDAAKQSLIMGERMAERIWQEEHGLFERPLSKAQQDALVKDPKVSPEKHARLLRKSAKIAKYKAPPAEIFDDWVMKDPKIKDEENTD